MRIGIIGGDSRIVELAKLLKKDNLEIFTYGLENAKLGITELENLYEMSNKTDIIISSIPLSKNQEEIIAKFTDKKLAIEEVFSQICKKTLICGNVTDKIDSIAFENDVKIIDILKEEELTVLNCIPTAEGAIQIAMQESDITLHTSNVLILGFGRIGKILAKMLDGIGANVYCEARKKEDLAWIDTYQYNKVELVNLEENLEKYDFIFNTIPSLILDKEKLKRIKKECIIIDLASNPGGTDFEFAKEMKIKAILALALPGKVAPKTAAQYIKNTIKQYIQ